jgi:hypothetical protein
MSTDDSFDKFLDIDTGVQVGPLEPVEDNNIYQATYYRDLVTLFDQVSMEPEDTLVDFGCGLGRVIFYGNSRHYCRTVGVEANPDIFAGLMDNVKRYQSKFLEQEERMFFHNMSAEQYEIQPEDNYFYFFNPFSGGIFKRVVENIIESAKKHPRNVNIMLYYPTFEYQKIIRDSKHFVLKKIVKLSHYNSDPDEKVYVYHLIDMCL